MRSIDAATGRLAAAAGLVAIGSDAAYGLFVLARGPFGTVNDLGNASFAVLAGSLAWRFRARTGTPLAALAAAGAATAVLGSSLVISGRTGWMLGAFVSATGLGLVAPSVVATARDLAREPGMSAALTRLGQATGALMLVGVTGVVPAAMRLDDPATAPAWSWLAFAGWIGAMVLYPAWALALARRSAPPTRAEDVPARA